MHNDQVGFVLAINGWLNIWKPINTIILTVKNKNHMIISIDTEKAFDKIHCPSLTKILSEIEIKRNFLDLIKGI